jgi:DNA-binding NtrC family response regulator
MTATVLVIDDDPRMLQGLGKLLRKRGWEVRLAANGETGVRMLREQQAQVVLTDLKMPGLDGLAVLRHVKESAMDAEVVLLTGLGSIDDAVTAMKQGAFDFLTKPPDIDRLLEVIRLAAQRQAMRPSARASQATGAATGAPAFVAESPAMKRVVALVERLAEADATVLIQGESGTGKELVARALHATSPRSAQPFVAVNCAAVPEALIESELLGYEKGAFTGAAHRKPGKFELADGGTLFLDEVGELAPGVQPKLLRVLQEHEIERLGGVRPVRIDVRVVAATNRDLRALVRAGQFREDLYYRLNVVTIDLPPLRARPEDLGPLAERFLRLHAGTGGKRVEGFSAPALALMRRYRWPGNVRELEHAVQRAVIFAAGPEITPADLELPADEGARPVPPTGEATLDELERQQILAALERCGGNRTAAAAALGIDRTTLHRKLNRYNGR